MKSWPVRRDPIFGCILWVGRKDKWGYPRTNDGRLAHRAVYESERGPIADDMELDHTCRRRTCVFHLEAVTRAENGKRKRWSYRLGIKTCPRGHELTQETRAVTPEGGYACRLCAQK